MNGRRTFIVAAMVLTVIGVARSGHEMPVYPSYYPHEIELAAVTPERAAELLLAGRIQAYVGRAPRFSAAPPATVESVASLGSFVIVRVNPSSPRAGDARSTCALAETVIRDFAGRNGNFIPHPYPVTPWHGDYLYHADLAEAAKARILGGRVDPPAGAQNPKVKAEGELARSLVRSGWRSGDAWDVEVAEVDAAELAASMGYSMNGWLGPAWIKSGWFHASLLLAGGDAPKAQLQRLQTGGYDGAVERINLERSLVTALAGNCQTLVAGYTVKREYFSTVFTAGIENIAYDSLDGFNSPMFIRTVKLKDFPWNGWLALGIDAQPSAAWNPVAGFTGSFGRLMWSAVGDPALIPSPYESAWVLNRITDVQSGERR